MSVKNIFCKLLQKVLSQKTYIYCYVTILTWYRKTGMRKKFLLIDVAILSILMCVLC